MLTSLFCIYNYSILSLFSFLFLTLQTCMTSNEIAGVCCLAVLGEFWNGGIIRYRVSICQHMRRCSYRLNGHVNR
jgi:hypothetical protein